MQATTFSGYVYGRHVLQRRLFDVGRTLLLAPQFVPYPSVERIQASVILSVYTEVTICYLLS